MAYTRKDPFVKEEITLQCGRTLAYCEHGRKDGEPVIYFSGAGFGRSYVPTPFENLLEQKGVRLLTVDRPGYGASDPHSGRTYQDWATDVNEWMDAIGLQKARFVAHSAGTPHLAAICNFIPEKVMVASFVCPVSPITGSSPIDRPSENFTRGCLRFCLLNCGGFLDGVFGSVFKKWQADPKQFVKDSMGQIVAEKDVTFMKEHPDFFQEQYAADFGDAVKPPNGVSAMLQDMFHLNRVPWGFGYSDLKTAATNTSSASKYQVWYGGADDTAPNGKWICEQLGIEGRCIDDAGHGLIHSEFGPILDALLKVGSY